MDKPAYDDLPKSISSLKQRLIEHHQDSAEMAANVQNDTYAALFQLVKEGQTRPVEELRTEVIELLRQLDLDADDNADADVVKLVWATVRGYIIERDLGKGAQDDF